MPGSNNAVNNLIFGLSIAGTAQADADNANRRALDAETRAMQAELEAAGKTTDRTLELRLDEATRRERIANNANDALTKELAEKDALISEWMHSNEAFKRLARQYGKKLGISDEQRKKDFNENIIDVAEENPAFANTHLLELAKTPPAPLKP